MYDRAPRLFRWAGGSTAEQVGPATYQLQLLKPQAADGYAPFLSLTSRESTFAIGAPNAKKAGPGPGHYNVSQAQHNIKGGQSLKNREKRFQKVISDGPGPASYNQSSRTLKTPSRKFYEAKECRPAKIPMECTVSRSIVVPSIPSCRQSQGYEINEDESIMKRLLPDSDETLGPAFYQPRLDFPSAMKYKGIKFGQSMGRLAFPVNSVPGPGQYDITQKKTPHYENVNIKKDQVENTSSYVPRFYEIIMVQETKRGIPGPGKYDIKSQFQKMGSKTLNAVCKPPAFLSQAKRFVPVKSIVPAPGTYFDAQKALKPLKKCPGPRNASFGQSAPRFLQKSRTEKMPGPASYNIAKNILVDSVSKTCSKKKSKCAFGTSAPRVSFLGQRDAESTPGPLHYQFDVYDEFLCMTSQPAAFLSKTERYPTLSNMDTPVPGYYDVQKSYDASRGRPKFMPPRSFEAQVKHCSFLSTVPRCLYKVHEGPGPATYNPVLWKTCRIPLHFKKSRRFKELKEVTPGPATYELSTFLRNSVLKKTFNATLKNPVLDKSEGSPTAKENVDKNCQEVNLNLQNGICLSVLGRSSSDRQDRSAKEEQSNEGMCLSVLGRSSSDRQDSSAKEEQPN